MSIELELGRLVEMITSRQLPSDVALASLEDQLRCHWRDSDDAAALAAAEGVGMLRRWAVLAGLGQSRATTFDTALRLIKLAADNFG